ncbi:hypothetical protein A3Q56_06499 [Intoshia linei]|uniref:PHD-type domain-containing protein n=1 Tax=Intoshia linei TaxID=1819745 RepID=A0A177AUS0_9BILA|nr:hypothetical protein A3Q56_06499 [Intoshia linei]
MIYRRNLDLPLDANRTGGGVVNDQELKNVGKYYGAIILKNYDKTVPKRQAVEAENYRNNDPVLGKLDQRKRKVLEEKNDALGGSEPIDTTGKFCYCNRGEIEGDFMVECDRCRKWFHGQCVELTKTEADELDTFCCKYCVRQNGAKRRRLPSKFNDYILNLKSRRVNSKRIDCEQSAGHTQRICDKCEEGTQEVDNL